MISRTARRHWGDVITPNALGVSGPSGPLALAAKTGPRGQLAAFQRIEAWRSVAIH